MEAILFIGIQATGKTTFYKTHFADTHIRINLDMLKTRHREKKLFECCLEIQQPFVIDNTNLSRQDRQRYIPTIKRYGIAFHGYYFASPLQDGSESGPLKEALEKIETKVLFASHNHEINSLFDIVLPMSLIAEKGGSLTNIVGSVQNFSPALDALGDCKPAWQFLVELAKKLSINFDFYKPFSSLESIREVVEEENPFFREIQ